MHRNAIVDCSRQKDKCARRRSEEHTSELQSRQYLVCRLLLENKESVQPESYASSSRNAASIAPPRAHVIRGTPSPPHLHTELVRPRVSASSFANPRRRTPHAR